MTTQNDDKQRHCKPEEDNNCEQTVNICCSEVKTQHHYLEPKAEYCCYEISMRRFRVLDNSDGGENRAELMIAGYANQHSAVFPGLGCWVVAHHKWGWVNINKVIGEFRCKKGSPQIVMVGADAVEAGVGLIEGNFEIGSHQDDADHLKIGCGTGVTQVKVKVPIHDVDNQHGDKNKAMIEIEFFAYEKSCCC